MQLRVVLAKIGIGVSLLASLAVSGQALAADDDYSCMQLMYEHGLATSAQAHCGYRYYNQTIISSAAQCMSKGIDFGIQREMEDALKAGVEDFQGQYNQASDKNDICGVFLADFGEFVSN
jgi:hypothetical protein